MTPLASRPVLAGALLVAVLAAQASALHLYGQPTFCTCGTIRLWAGDVLGPENSQQITDWYTFSHVIHGLIFYALGALALPRAPLLVRFALALGIEATWELIENSPTVIEHYRQQALAQGYVGDSILNSCSDTVAAAIGFLVARLVPTRVSIGLALAFEIFTAVTIRDNLTLNVVQLIHPVPAIAAWQQGLAPSQP